jgi:hypothetical protein
MQRYDPLKAPNPKEWLALDEDDRNKLVEDYHRRAGIRLPRNSTHAMIHVVVENQAALADETPVARALDRLMVEGLDRHDAVHAIGSVLADFLYEAASEPARADPAEAKQEYFAAVEELTAEDWRQSAAEPAVGEIEVTEILDRLGSRDGLPVDAIRAARAQRAAVLPIFLQAIERTVEGTADEHNMDALFVIFHLLGEWREKTAYRPLARLLHQPTDAVELILGDAITETSHRVMAAVFDGDPQPLYDIILDETADEFVRSCMCDALVILVRQGRLSRAEAARFLTACFTELQPREECSVWVGWTNTIAQLALAELKPMVDQAFKRGSIAECDMSFKDFEEDLGHAIAGSEAPFYPSDYTLIGDTIEELSRLAAFDVERDQGEEDADDWEPPAPTVPAVNPFKNVGRNDPCPCGSGKKFKKCCLAKPAAA